MNATIEELLDKAGKSRNDSPFDYVIVGSGAGGGPLAARLAEAGKTVLLLEAGHDPAHDESLEFPDATPGEVHQVPGYYTAASEDAKMSWQFSVRHYDDLETQELDDKYNRLDEEVENPANPGQPPVRYPRDPRFLDHPHKKKLRKGGVFYPRTAALGGCTAHHAMIIIAPNDRDWNDIADLTGDDTWRAENMRGYFAKLERCLYLDAYRGFFKRLLGPVFTLLKGIVRWLNPKAALDNGGHGTKGWQPTSFIDPDFAKNAAKADKTFLKVVARAILSVVQRRSLFMARLFKRALAHLRVVSYLDPNDLNTRRKHPQGAFLIPLGVESEPGNPRVGRRTGVREFLLETAEKHPERLVIKQRVQVTKVLFQNGDDDVPEAVGVQYVEGEYLYETSPLYEEGAGKKKKPRRFFARDEVILCGGAFNTPQLLMLSGIGEETQLGDYKIPEITGIDGKPLDKADGKAHGRIHLPGVGRNLQDRYEVTVVSEIDKEFSTLDGVSFVPGDPNDPYRRQWLQDKSGLYTINGGIIAILQRSTAAEKAGEPEPDTFTFGVPAAFRGYYWGWSREVFKPTLGAEKEQRNLWTWVILKAYTRNHAGTVRLVDGSPFRQPEICFDSFDESTEKAQREVEAEIAACRERGEEPPANLVARFEENERILADSRKDLQALVDAVRWMRQINGCNPDQFVEEVQPGVDIADDSEEMEKWIRTQAWGHHASCTCRIGADPWRDNVGNLEDTHAVLDSKFRVHGVRNLRIVDASVFPKIPGYFIVTPIFMISEKAADTILADAAKERTTYPAAFEAKEAAAIHKRRAKAHPGSTEENELPEDDPSTLPKDTVGLALSGGGLRSATFALGVLQALAGRNRVRDIDMLSTVSGGGFTGSFFGRLFTRSSVTAPPPGASEPTDPCGRVQEVLSDSRSGPLFWLRTHANYILNPGTDDLRQNLATIWRNAFTVYLVVGSLLFAVFGSAAGISSCFKPLDAALPDWLALSAWWCLPALVLGAGLLPATLGFWLAPKTTSTRPYPVFSLLAWLVLLGGALASLLLPHGNVLLAAVVVLLLSWVWQEIARWGAPKGSIGSVVRNRLTRALGKALLLFIVLLVWFVLDTLARSVAKTGAVAVLAGLMVALAPVLPALQKMARSALNRLGSEKRGGFSLMVIGEIVSIPLALFLLFVLDVLAHKLFLGSAVAGWMTVVLAALFSFAIGRAFEFLNFSSLHSAYAARIARTYQGASNDARVHGASSDIARDIQLVHPSDDTPFHLYHPEENGGPLHLVNVCVNDTVEFASDRDIRERKGFPMAVGPHGATVGREYFAEWAKPDNLPRWQKFRRFLHGRHAYDEEPVALRALRAPNDPNAFHVLASKKSDSAEVEPLTLGAWTAVSGAAYTTGVGRRTTFTFSLLMGLANLRLGYWWDSGIRYGERPGRYPLSFWRRLKRIPVTLFRMQSMLLSEWKARFHGPNRWFWYLSDGGHFENTGLYELIRRRLKFMIVTDGTSDGSYKWGRVGQIMRQARIDFGAEIRWIDFPDRTGLEGRTHDETQGKYWSFIEDTVAPATNEEELDLVFSVAKDWIDPTTLGSLSEIRNTPDKPGYHAALAYVTYDDSDDVSLVLLLKPSLADDIPEDVLAYARQNEKFPQDPTLNQFYDDEQWESYRQLGQSVGERVLTRPRENEG